MAQVYVPAAQDDEGLHRGFLAAQVGIFLDSMTESYSDDKTEILNHIGTPVGFIKGYDERYTISVSGEINDNDPATATSIMGAKFATAFAFIATVQHDTQSATTANDFFNGSVEPGGLYLESASISQSRSAVKALSMDFMSYATAAIT